MEPPGGGGSPYADLPLDRSNAKFSTSPPNHTFVGTYCLPFLKFALKQGKNFGADAPYRRVGFNIPKWHT